MAKALEFANKGEARAARKLINMVLAKGWLVSVNDGGEWVLKSSKDKAAILLAMATTGGDYLIFRDSEGNKIGGMYLVWGNEPCELVADHTDNEAINAIWNEWNEYAEKIKA